MWVSHPSGCACYGAWALGTSVQFSRSVVSDSCDPMNCSMLGLPVHHQLPEFTQTHVHRVVDAIQPSHPLSLRFLPPVPPSIRVFSNESTLHIRWPKYWSFSFNIWCKCNFLCTGNVTYRASLVSWVVKNLPAT